MVRIESPELVASLRDDAVATYQPVNSQELFVVERIALAQLNMHRLSAMEAGLFSNYLEAAADSPDSGQFAGDQTTSGFRRIAQESNVISLFLRYQAQAERLYRRAVETSSAFANCEPNSRSPCWPRPCRSSPLLPCAMPQFLR